MPLTTACIGAHVTPAVISTLFAHVSVSHPLGCSYRLSSLTTASSTPIGSRGATSLPPMCPMIRVST